MTVGDFNGDGKLDFIAVGASPTGPGWVLTTFLGNGDGTFRKGGAATFTDSAAEMTRVFVGDFNHDGKLDVIVYDTGNGYWTTNSNVWEFLGNGNGTFQPGIQLFSSFQPMTMADVNGDSTPDIVRYDFMWPDGTTQTFGPARFSTYLDQSSGAFTQSSSYADGTFTPTYDVSICRRYLGFQRTRMFWMAAVFLTCWKSTDPHPRCMSLREGPHPRYS
jgi:hypothetical protein